MEFETIFILTIFYIKLTPLELEVHQKCPILGPVKRNGTFKCLEEYIYLFLSEKISASSTKTANPLVTNYLSRQRRLWNYLSMCLLWMEGSCTNFCGKSINR